ncbi:MAG: hypothetical protein NT055_00275 [Nitrospirae bacterium]|nr:hypothetical protein [Nitrospirota bacterium]
MKDDLEFLKEFPKNENDMYIVYDRFTFDNLFRLLLQAYFDHEDALYFMLANCSMSALVFQERLHNKKYKKLSAEDALPVDEAARRAKVIYDLVQIAQGND